MQRVRQEGVGGELASSASSLLQSVGAQDELDAEVNARTGSEGSDRRLG